MRRDETGGEPSVRRLRDTLDHDEGVVTTGLELQELLQGSAGPRPVTPSSIALRRYRLQIPDGTHQVEAAESRNVCRRSGIQVGKIDVPLAQLCVRHDLVMLSTDRDFTLMAPHLGLTIWEPWPSASAGR